MNRYVNFACEALLSVCIMYGVGIFAYNLYALGYINGSHTLGAPRCVKKRIVKKGNIIEYPFGKTSRKTVETSNSDCPTQSGEGPEAA